MSHRDIANKKTAKYDPLCRNRSVKLLVNRMMKHGKKSLAYQIFYRAGILIKKKTKKNPLFVLRVAIYRVTPSIGVLKKRKGKGKKGRIIRVPIAIPASKGRLLAIRWLLEASRKRSGTSMVSQLRAELIDAAFKKRGKAIRKKELTHKMAESNRTSAHFRYRPRNKGRVQKQLTHKMATAPPKPVSRNKGQLKKQPTHKMAEASRTPPPNSDSLSRNKQKGKERSNINHDQLSPLGGLLPKILWKYHETRFMK